MYFNPNKLAFESKKKKKKKTQKKSEDSNYI